MKVTLLAGGFGGARMAHGFALLGSDVSLSVIGNTGDDLVVHGLYVAPDLDTVMYTLAGLANDATGWGVRDETWSAAEMLDRYRQPTWFRLGDRDIATHVVRTASLHAGKGLSQATRQLADGLGVRALLLPMTDDPVRTKVRTPDGWLDFQDYFVRRQHADDVLEIRFDGIDDARPTDEVIDAIASADLVVVAPSNPFVSVAPILSMPALLEALLRSTATTMAVSPIVGGSALRGPAAQMFRSLGGEASVTGVCRFYAERYPGLVDVLVIDRQDESHVAAVRELGIEPFVSDTVITEASARKRLATELLSVVSGGVSEREATRASDSQRPSRPGPIDP